MERQGPNNIACQITLSGELLPQSFPGLPVLIMTFIYQSLSYRWWYQDNMSASSRRTILRRVISTELRGIGPDAHSIQANRVDDVESINQES